MNFSEFFARYNYIGRLLAPSFMKKKSLVHIVCTCVKILHIFFIKTGEYLNYCTRSHSCTSAFN